VTSHPHLLGAGGTQYYRFQALKVGETEITVTYKRSWETEYYEQKVFTVDIWAWTNSYTHRRLFYYLIAQK